jgi:DNA-binding transcriptional ArsR family regulator
MSDNQQDEWLSLADLAKALGVAKSTVSRRVSQLEAGRLIDIRREGVRKLIQRAAYEAGCVVAVDGIKSLNSGSGKTGAVSTRLAEQQARRTAFAADIIEMRVAELRRNLLAAQEVREAMATAGGILARGLDQLRNVAEEVAEAVAKGGVPAARAVLKAYGRTLRQRFAAEMRSLAAGGSKTLEPTQRRSFRPQSSEV